MTTGRINQVTILHPRGLLVGGAAWKKPPEGLDLLRGRSALREEERPVQGTQQAELEERPRTIHLPPLSSPKDVPPQRRSGWKAATPCHIGPSGGGSPLPVTPRKGGYRSRPTPEDLAGTVAIGQPPTDPN